MSKPILAGYDPRTADRAPVLFAVEAARRTGAPVIVASVSARPAHHGQDDELGADATAALAGVSEDLEGLQIAIDSRQLHGTSAAGALHETAAAEDAGLLVIGSARRGIAGRAIMGSTAERLLQGAPCPVAVVPSGWAPTGSLDTIGAAFVDTREGREALRGAHVLAQRFGASLRVITVARETADLLLDTEAYIPPTRGRGEVSAEGEYRVLAEQAARRAVDELDPSEPVEVEGFVGDPADVLVDLSPHLSLLVCGSRGYGPLRSVLLGGVSRRVAAEARCPVVVVPRGVEASLEALLAEPATQRGAV